MAQPRPGRVVLINDRSASVGGASNLSRLLGCLLRERGIPVTFFAGDKAGANGAETDAVNLNGVPLIEQGRLSAFTSGLYNAPAFAALQQLIALSDTPSTIYHVHGWSKILSPSIFRALDAVHDRVVLHAHDYFLACPNGGFVNYPKGAVCQLAPMSARCLMTQCDKRGPLQKAWRSARHTILHRLLGTGRRSSNIILIHEGMRRYFERSGVAGDRIVSIRNPVEPFFRGGSQPWKSSSYFFVGRLEPEKGFEDAAKAARIAGVRLEVVGDGAGRTLLKQAYPEVVLHGWKDRIDIGRLLRSARAVVVASRVPEPFGLAVLEAAGSGIPVIVPSDALLSREIVELGCGMEFRTGDVTSLAAAMLVLARDENGVQRMSRSGSRNAARLCNTPQSWVDALMALYADVLERAGHPAGAGRDVAGHFGNRTTSQGYNA
jgi:glycosyltransferase involved in cell wall biosynthesis